MTTKIVLKSPIFLVMLLAAIFVTFWGGIMLIPACIFATVFFEERQRRNVARAISLSPAIGLRKLCILAQKL
jgi:hypothetical protein